MSGPRKPNPGPMEENQTAPAVNLAGHIGIGSICHRRSWCTNLVDIPLRLKKKSAPSEYAVARRMYGYHVLYTTVTMSG
jgi:hypothetical protein